MQRFKVKEGAVTFFKPGIIAESAMNLSAISCLLFLSDIMWSRVGVFAPSQLVSCFICNTVQGWISMLFTEEGDVAAHIL